MKINRWGWCKECDGKGYFMKADEFDTPIKHQCKNCEGRGTVEIKKLIDIKNYCEGCGELIELNEYICEDCLIKANK